MLEWLLTPLSGSTDHQVSFLVSWHARLMVLAWGVLIPLGVIVARFFKVTPRQDWPSTLDNRFWWNWHRLLQYGGMALAAAGLALALASGSMSGAMRTAHAVLGFAVLALGVLQLVSAWLRGSKGGPTAPSPDGSLRGDHYDMTARRYAFEYAHKFGGMIAVAGSVAAIVTGLILADAPRWMMLAMLGWWCALLAVFAVLQRRGHAIDTYQAIWGPGAGHPGNRTPTVGFGVRRLPPDATRPFGPR